MADVSQYLGLVTSEHSSRPKFSAMVAAVAQCFVDQINVMQSIPAAFDLDTAVGVQLDAVGLWAGITRQVKTPLNVYFSLDTANLGFDQGNWQGPFDPSTGLVSLDDATFRTLIHAKIAANSWDGTVPGAASAYANLFGSPSTSSLPTSVTAQQFAIGDGATSSFQLTIGGQPLFSVSSAQIYRSDWQGNQLLYATARTNYCVGSNNLAGAEWVLTDCSVTGSVTGPDGTASGSVVEITTSGQNDYFVNVSPGNFAGEVITFSVWLKQGSGADNNFTLRLRDGSFNEYGSEVVSVTPSWVRYTLTATFPAGAATGVQIYVDRVNAAATGDSVLFAFAQVEIGGAPTSYIPTTTAAVTVTDYVLSSTGLAALASAPVSGAVLTWTGTGTPIPAGSFIFIQDGGDMTMTVGVSGAIPSALLRALLSGGYLHLKPEGVHASYLVSSANNTPLFGFDVENLYISGMDVGSFAVAA